MRLFFALSSMSYKEQLIQNDIKNLLVALPYANNHVLKHLDDYLDRVKDVNFILDSGAFSVWTKGETIDLEEYIKFCKMFKSRFGDRLNSLSIVNLDKIPAEPGRKPTYAEVEESARIGRENFLRMTDEGLNVIPVFHQHEDLKWLEFMKKEVDYIGISPANDVSTKVRMIWLDNVYADLKADYKTHSFGGIAERILKRYPVFSGDSSSWTHWDRWGGGSKYKIEGRTSARDAILFGIRKDIEQYKKMGDDITRLWEMRGIKWEK